MAYTPNPTDTSQPVGSVPAGTAAAEFRALKSYLGGILGSVQAFNPLDSTPSLTISNGNLTVTKNATTGNQTAIRASFSKSSGKWYWEVNILAFLAANQQILGIATSLFTLTNYVGSDTKSYGYGGSAGNKYINAVSTAFGAAFAVNDVIGFAFDADAHTLQVFKNNVSQGTITGLTAGAYFPAISELTVGDSLTGVFDSKSLKYAPPAGFSPFYNSASTGVIYASVFLGTTEGLVSGVFTKLAFDTVEFDNKTWWDLANFRYTPQQPGKYKIHSSFLSASNSGVPLSQIIAVYINGSVYKTSTLSITGPSTSDLSKIVQLNGTTDYIEIWGYVLSSDGSSCSAVAVNTWIDIEYIGS